MASNIGILVVDIQLKHLKELGSLFYPQSLRMRAILSPMGHILEEKVNHYHTCIFLSATRRRYIPALGVTAAVRLFVI